MKIALIGATGVIGSRILDELLQRGHDVTALLRNPNKLKDKKGVTVVKGDAQDAAQVADAVRGADMVVSSFYPGSTNPNVYEEYISGAKAIVQGTKDAGVERLLVVGGGGSLLDENGTQIVDRPDFPKEYHAGASAVRDAFNSLKQEQELNWTFLSPPPLYGSTGRSGRTGQYQLGKDHPLSTDGGQGDISAQDLGVAVVDEVEKNAHPRQRFTVAN